MKLIVDTIEQQLTILVDDNTDVEQTFTGFCLEKADYVTINGWQCDIIEA